MKPWLRRTVGILTLGGGFVGVAIGTQTVAATPMSVFNKAFMLAFVGAYALGVWIGLRVLEQVPRASDAAAAYWLLQVPTFMSPIAGYKFAAGGAFFVFWTYGQGFGMQFQLGSRFEWSLLEAQRPWMLGMNLLAFAISVLLLRESLRRSPRVDATAGQQTVDDPVPAP
jgi:hypothetical protein